MKIVYPKETRQYATENNRDLFAFGMDGTGGRIDVCATMDRGTASKLTLFCIKVTQGVGPQEAMEEAYGNKWTQEPPVDQGEYWHWNGDVDYAPLPVSVLKSGSDNKCFVARGQWGIEQAVDCEEFGGWWKRITTPVIPKI